MYGSAYRARALPGHERDLLDLIERWTRERGTTVDGYMGEYILRSEKEPDEWTGVVVFRDRESYMRNANDPEQDRWFRELRKHLVADPQWDDGEIVFADATGLTRQAAAR